jgi:hypothetical protein
MRYPRDKLSQRVLVWDLRHAIDRVMRRPWDTVARQHLDSLIDENPHSVRASHVLYNIGIVRRNFLAQHKAGPRTRGALPSRADPHSLEASR